MPPPPRRPSCLFLFLPDHADNIHRLRRDPPTVTSSHQWTVYDNFNDAILGTLAARLLTPCPFTQLPAHPASPKCSVTSAAWASHIWKLPTRCRALLTGTRAKQLPAQFGKTTVIWLRRRSPLMVITLRVALTVPSPPHWKLGIQLRPPNWRGLRSLTPYLTVCPGTLTHYPVSGNREISVSNLSWTSMHAWTPRWIGS